MPGHSTAAIASYPIMSSTGNTNAVSTTMGVKNDYLKLSEPFTKQFITDVLTSFAALFPSEYIHIGGDECQSTTAPDYAAFIRWVEQLLKGLGKKMVGWDEISQLYLGEPVYQEPSTRVQRWHKGGTGNVVSWCDHFYFDMKNRSSDDSWTSLSWCAIVTLQTVYTTNLGNAGSDCVGFEAPYWSEMTHDQQDNTDLNVAADHMWPR
jgi:hexosaminidase